MITWKWKWRTVPIVLIITVIILAAFMVTAGFFVVNAMQYEKPGPVKGVRTTATYDTVTLTWKPSENADSYIVYRGAGRYGFPVKVGTVKEPTFTDTELETGEQSYYRICAVNGKRRGGKTPRVFAAPTLETPELTRPNMTGEGIYLAIKDAVPGASGYQFYRDGKLLADQKDLVYLDSDVEVGKSHCYRAVAYRFVEKKVSASKLSVKRYARKPSVEISLRDSNIGELSQLYGEAPFQVTGTVKSNTTIRKVEAGVIDTAKDEWMEGAKAISSDVNGMTCDIAPLGEKIHMETLPLGSYEYRVVATLKNGERKTVTAHPFEVIEPPGSVKIVETATQLAWPQGTSKKVYSYPNGNPTDAFKEAIDRVYPGRGSWGKQTRAGASCDVFVGTVIRASGYDPDFPRGLDGVVKHCASHPELWEDTGITSQSDMQPGDVVFHTYGGGGHIMIYLGDNLLANAHYVGKTFGVVEKASGYVKKRSSTKTYKVYRPVK